MLFCMADILARNAVIISIRPAVAVAPDFHRLGTGTYLLAGSCLDKCDRQSLLHGPFRRDVAPALPNVNIQILRIEPIRMHV